LVVDQLPAAFATVLTSDIVNPYLPAATGPASWPIRAYGEDGSHA
jgi:hypothetical protein